MNEILFMIFAFIEGLLLGTLFFGGLWLTVMKAVTSKVPAIWFSVSLFIRLGITLTGFYYISIGSWQRLLVCVIGFIVARIIVIRFTGGIEGKKITVKKKIDNEA